MIYQEDLLITVLYENILNDVQIIRAVPRIMSDCNCYVNFVILYYYSVFVANLKLV